MAWRQQGAIPARVLALPSSVSGGGGGSHFGGPAGATPRMLNGGESGDGGVVPRTSIPPFGLGFSRHRGLPIRWVFWRAQRHAPPRSGHRLDEPTRLSLGNGCIPAVPASVSPGGIIVTPDPPRLPRKWEHRANEPVGHRIFAIKLWISIDPKICYAPERSAFPSGAGASGSNHLPWAFPRVLQPIPKIKRAAGGNG
jgi:hypothetical protein